jgi:hypothetical protein
MSDIPQDRYWSAAHDKPSLLTHMMQFLAGDAHISVEGFLSNCQFPASIQQLPEEASILKRNTIVPRLDFTILSLEENTITPILDTILPSNRYKNDIIHIQIEKQGNYNLAVTIIFIKIALSASWVFQLNFWMS